MRQHSTAPHASHSVHDDGLVNFIQENALAFANRTAAAAACGLSSSQLGRRLKAATGKTYQDIIDDTRMQHARRLLLSEKYSTSAIAEYCGYDSRVYFSQAFKRFHGCSPRDWVGKQSPNR